MVAFALGWPKFPRNTADYRAVPAGSVGLGEFW
jgi:hypothetical protein